MNEVSLLRWIPAVPLASALLLGVSAGLFRRSFSRPTVAALGCGSVLASFVLSGVALGRLLMMTPAGEGPEGGRRMLLDIVGSWMGVGIGNGAFSADLAFQLDALSGVMTLLVAGVASLIHLFAVGMMERDVREDGSFQRLFALMNLFVAAMLLLVLADNLVLLFLGWEGLAACSYLSVAFWYSDDAHARAGTKAFVVNRIGDLGFLAGTLLLFWSLSEVGSPTVAFREIEAALPLLADQRVAMPAWLWGGGEWALPSLIALGFFVAGGARSAQFPLHVWLPDATAAPTPVLALIHAATMVMAGVYLMCRLGFLLVAAPEAAPLIAWTGAATAFLGASVAMAQHDLKKVLAWSTVSQLGFIFVALGCGAYAAALFHVVTHAFVTAALFLGAGCVLVACSHEQDMRRLGGLRTRLPRTHLSMLVSVLALAGLPPFAVFFSKDPILLAAQLTEGVPGRPWLYRLLLASAGLTSFYAFRLYFMIFGGRTRLELMRRARIREPGRWMSHPLGVLALLAVVGGALGLPQFWGDVLAIDGSDSLGRFVGEVLPATAIDARAASLSEGESVAWSVLVFLLGAMAALQLHGLRDAGAREAWTRWLGPPYRALARGYWIDEALERLVVRPLRWMAESVLYRSIELAVIDRAGVHGVAASVRGFADGVLRPFHAGWVQSHLMSMLAGVALVLLLLAFAG